MSDLLQGGNFPEFIGVVEDRLDPEMRRRVRVRCFGIHSADKVQIPTASLPWARVSIPTNAPKGSTCNLWEGTLVHGIFLDGDEYQQPLILGIIESMDNANDSRVGFNDPRPSKTVTRPGEVPITDSSLGTSRYADASLYSQTVAASLKTTATGTKADGGSYSEPSNPAKPKYPYNVVQESESGHVIEIDDTPGAERVHIFHRSGSFLELHPNGDIVYKSVGNNDTITLKNRHDLTIGNTDIMTNGNNTEAIGGNSTETIGGNLSISVSGNASINVSGNVTETVGGNYTTTVGGNFTVKASKINLN